MAADNGLIRLNVGGTVSTGAPSVPTATRSDFPDNDTNAPQGTGFVSGAILRNRWN